ncbi:MAG: TonB-dependent receptor [Bryobacteraceae bacterium]|nr:TonB-dependent receptor [Bryobacteraceae bacterium]
MRLLLLLVLTAMCLPGQTLRGLITGRTVPAAKVTVTSAETGRSRAAIALEDGRFTIPSLAPGMYRVSADAPGHQGLARDVTLAVNHEIDIDLPLLPLGRSDEIEVRDTAPLLRTESPAAGGWVAPHQVVDLPLDGRNYYELSLLMPGVTLPAQGSAGSVRGNFAMNANGSREDGNLFLLDGVYNADPKLNGAGITSPVDGIREFEVATANYDASFGRNAGAQVNVVLKSGTNEFHGAAYHFFRNARLDARNFFAPAAEPDPRYQRNQYGYAVGGPIRRDRTFFFTDFEGRRLNEGLPRETNVPTALERIGDFSQSGVPFVIDPFTQSPFPGNRIPSFYLNPVGVNIANLYPLPNRDLRGRNFISAPILRDNSETFDARLDHSLSQRSELTGRYSVSDRRLNEPFAGNAFAQFPGYGNVVPHRAQNAMIGNTHVFSPNLINELRLGYNRVAIQVNQENQGADMNRAVGLPTFAQRPRQLGLSYISVLGYSPLGDEYNNPQASASNTYQLINNTTWTRGRTIWKFGTDIRKFDQRAFRDVQSRGLINFVGFTGNAMTELLLGIPAVTGGARLDNRQHLRGESYNFFAQANTRVLDSLTLNFGVRYELNAPPVDPGDRASLYNPLTGGISQVGTEGLPRAGYAADRNNFGPRFGFAWSPGDRKTVLRGGYGIYFDQAALAPSEGLYFSAPYFDFRLFVTSQQFPLTLQNPFPENFPFPTPASAFTFNREMRTPYIQHFSLQVQRQLGRSTVAELGYLGAKGTRLLMARDINQPAPSATQFPLRPNPMFQDINELESRAASNFHSLQASLRRSLSRGVSLLASYTYGKSIDDASNFFPSAGDANFPQDSRDTSFERARSSFDVRQRLTAAGIWLIPCPHKAKARWLLAGWQVNGIATLQTGRPFTVALPGEVDNSGTGRSSLGFGANDRPNIVGSAPLANPGPGAWFNTGAFAFPVPGTFGNAGRNILDGPGLAALNVSVLKNFEVIEGTTLQFRVESFNALNRTNFNQPQNFLGAAGFGAITSAQNPRLVQLGLKFLF